MKKTHVLSVLFLMLTFFGCTVPYNRLRHSETPYHTKGMYSIFKAVGSLVRIKYGSEKRKNSFPYVINSTMRADEFVDTAAIYKDKLVSYSARIEFSESDVIRMIWDYQPQRFGADQPKPLLFPYPNDNEHTNAYYYIKFIPVEVFQKARPVTVWDNSNLIAGIKFKDILYLETGGMENKGGFINVNYPGLYNNNFSALGIIFKFHLIDGSSVACYLITSDMFNNESPHYVRWKIKV